MHESFKSAVINRFDVEDAAPIPPKYDIAHTIKDTNTEAWAIMLDKTPVGGAVIRRPATNTEKRYSLELLFIFNEHVNKKLGYSAWLAIEKQYPNAEIWETHTPYFERRNIHFYINKCGFKVVEFYCEHHREEHDLTNEFKDINTSGFFRFEKRMTSEN